MSMRDLLRARSEAPLEALELGPIIGRGSFGRVYRGQAAAYFSSSLPLAAVFAILAGALQPVAWQSLCGPATFDASLHCLLLTR